MVIFGNSQTAELAKYYLDNDSEFSVSAFCIDADYLKQDSFMELPIIAFEDVVEDFDPEEYYFFAPMTADKMNASRKRVYETAKMKGYDFISYISSKSTVFTKNIGENCFILENNTIQPFVEIGNNNVLWSGNHIGHHSVVGDHNFFTSQVVLSGNCTVSDQCFFGVNSTIRDYCNIGIGTLLGMGATLTKKRTDPWGVYNGNPATINPKRKSTDFM